MKLNSRWVYRDILSKYVFLRAPLHEKEMIENVMIVVTGEKPNIYISRNGEGNLLCMLLGIEREIALEIDTLMDIVEEKL